MTSLVHLPRGASLPAYLWFIFYSYIPWLSLFLLPPPLYLSPLPPFLLSYTLMAVLVPLTTPPSPPQPHITADSSPIGRAGGALSRTAQLARRWPVNYWLYWLRTNKQHTTFSLGSVRHITYSLWLCGQCGKKEDWSGHVLHFFSLIDGTCFRWLPRCVVSRRYLDASC